MYRLIHQKYGCKIPVMARPISPRMVTSTWTVPVYLPTQCLESRGPEMRAQGHSTPRQTSMTVSSTPTSAGLPPAFRSVIPSRRGPTFTLKVVKASQHAQIRTRKACFSISGPDVHGHHGNHCKCGTRACFHLFMLGRGLQAGVYWRSPNRRFPGSTRYVLYFLPPCTLQTFSIILVGGEIEFDLGRTCNNQGLLRRSDFPDEAYKNSTRAEACYKGHLQVSNMPHGLNSATSDHHKMLQNHPWVFTLCEPMVKWWGSPDENLSALPGWKRVQWNDDLAWTWWFPRRYSKSNGGREQFRLKLLFLYSRMFYKLLSLVHNVYDVFCFMLDLKRNQLSLTCSPHVLFIDMYCWSGRRIFITFTIHLLQCSLTS